MPTVRLTWQEGAPEQAGDGFRIYRSVNGGAFSLLQTLPITATQYDDTDVSWGNFYQYRVCEYYLLSESPCATGAAIFKSDVGIATDSAFFPSRFMPLGDTASGQDARVFFRATHIRGDTGLTVDVSTLLATLVRNDQVTLTVTEVGTLVEAFFLSSDTGSGAETVQWIARGYCALAAEDGGIGAESLPALSTLLSALQIARGAEQAGEVEAVAIVEDVGDGTDKALYTFIKHFGAPWGATKVRLEAVQEK